MTIPEIMISIAAASLLIFAIKKSKKPKQAKQRAPIPYEGWKVGDIVVYREEKEYFHYVSESTFLVTSWVVQAFRDNTVIYRLLFEKSEHKESKLQYYYDSLCNKPQVGCGSYYEVVEHDYLKYNSCEFFNGRGNISLIKRNRDKKQQELEAYVKAYQETA